VVVQNVHQNYKDQNKKIGHQQMIVPQERKKVEWKHQTCVQGKPSNGKTYTYQ
jgi:hypothetical protein